MVGAHALDQDTEHGGGGVGFGDATGGKTCANIGIDIRDPVFRGRVGQIADPFRLRPVFSNSASAKAGSPSPV